jgi:hypothetical protein
MSCNIGGAPALARRRRIPPAGRNPSDHGLKAIERTNETIQSHAGQPVTGNPAPDASLLAQFAVTVIPISDTGTLAARSRHRTLLAGPFLAAAMATLRPHRD